jgi:hypothetical protein
MFLRALVMLFAASLLVMSGCRQEPSPPKPAPPTPMADESADQSV